MSSLLSVRGDLPTPQLLVEEYPILTLIQDTRPVRYKVWSLLAGIALNTLALGMLLVAEQVSAVRRSTDRMMVELRRELSRYRLILLLPTPATVVTEPRETPRARKSPRHATAAPKPLAVPDPRLLSYMEAGLAGFVRENPAIESIVTRELVRDLDSKALDLAKLLHSSGIRISFDVDENGQIGKQRIEKSSRVPSIDHLSLELIPLLDKYQLLWVLKGFRNVVAEILVEDQIVVTLEGELRNPEQLEEIRRRILGAMAFLRLAMGKDEAAFILDDAILSAEKNRLVLSKAFEKDRLVAYFRSFSEGGPAK